MHNSKILANAKYSNSADKEKNYWLFKQCLDKKKKKTLSHKVYSAELPSSLFFLFFSRKLKKHNSL